MAAFRLILKFLKGWKNVSTYLNPTKTMSLDYDDCPPLVEKFIQHEISALAKKPRTVNAYYVDIRIFLRWLWVRAIETKRGHKLADEEAESMLLKQIPENLILSCTTEDIDQFSFYLADQRGNSPTTRLHKLIALNVFYQWLVKKQKLMDANPVANADRPKVEKYGSKKPIYMMQEDAERLMTGFAGTRYEERDKCIIAVFLCAGLRLTELVSLNLEDYHEFDSGINALDVRGKGGKFRVVYLPDSCVEIMNEYLAQREEWVGTHKVPENSRAFFVSPKTGARLTGRAVQMIISKHVTATGVSSLITPHKLRHTAATLLYQSNAADLLTLQNFLGHSSPVTTEIYVHLHDRALMEAAKKSPFAIKGTAEEAGTKDGVSHD